MNVLDKTSPLYRRAVASAELNTIRQYRQAYDTLVKISQKLAVDDMGCTLGYALVVQWSRTCGYELHQSLTLDADPRLLLQGHQKIYRWEDIVNCALNFMVNNHTDMGNDLGIFLNELCKVSQYLSDNFNDRCRIDQVEPHIFRVMSDESIPVQLFTWKQTTDGYSITRSRKPQRYE